MRSRKNILVAALLVTVAISLCACGDDDNKDAAALFKDKTANMQSGSKDGATGDEEADTPKDDNGFERDEKGYIISYSGGGGKIEIPAKIGSVDIAGIGYRAFKDNAEITEVTMPDTVTGIDAEAFAGCANLQTVTFSKNLAYIDIHAFSDCVKLSDVELPDSCKSVGDSAFSGSGRAVFMGSGAEYGNRCFEESNFDYIGFAAGADISGYGVFMGSGVRDVGFPEDMEALGESAFTNCTQMTKIELPDTVKTLGEGVFSNMKILPRLKLSEGLTELPKDMTVGTSTDVIVVPQSVKKICYHSIYEATLTVIQSPDVEIEEGGVQSAYISLARANDFNFPSCENDEVALEGDRLYLDGVYSSADIKGDFYNATTIAEQVYLPVDASEEESDAFDEYLVSIDYPEISWIAGIAPDFLPDSTMCFTMDDHMVTGCESDGELLSIPWSVLDEEDGMAVHRAAFGIADGAFENSSYKTVYLHGNFGDGVGSAILNGNTSLTDIWFNSSLVFADMPEEHYSSDSFAGIPENVTVHLPITLTASQKSDAESYLHSIGIPQGAKFDYYSVRQ